jgi:hypothetical protein
VSRYDRIRLWLHKHYNVHRYDCRATVDEFEHEGNLVIKITDYQWCRYCHDAPSKMNIEWRVMGPVSQFPLKKKPNS